VSGATRYGISRSELGELLASWGEASYRTEQVWDGLYRRRSPLEELTVLSKGLRARLADALPCALQPCARSTGDGGETIKWLWDTPDGAQVETVLMAYPDRATVCVSSQAGCAMGCTFCATGQAGFERHLTAAEIVEQVVRACHASPRRVSNVVFMGMGEPLANYDATWDALCRLHDDLGLSARHLTVSTVGVPPGMRRLAAGHLPVTLAVSLHAPDDALRNSLVPLNRRYPLAEVLDAARHYLAARGRRLSFEYALMAGVNDRLDQADALAALVGPCPPALPPRWPASPSACRAGESTPPCGATGERTSTPPAASSAFVTPRRLRRAWPGHNKAILRREP
jgi:23S rRNA (adenine2503-C2)-methyltransferase